MSEWQRVWMRYNISQLPASQLDLLQQAASVGSKRNAALPDVRSNALSVQVNRPYQPGPSSFYLP